MLVKTLEKYQFEAVEITDVASSDFSAVLSGVDVIIHTAAPLPGCADVPTALNICVAGHCCPHPSRGRQGRPSRADIEKVVVTGPMVTFPQGEYGPNENIFGQQTVDSSPDTTAVTESNRNGDFKTSKKHAISREVIWRACRSRVCGQSPEMDIAIRLTCITFRYQFALPGSVAPGFEHLAPEFDFSTLSSNAFVYKLLRPDNVSYPYFLTGATDVRDVARIHIAGLNPLTKDHPRRIATCSPHSSDYREAIRFIAEERPELRNRLADQHGPDLALIYDGRRPDAAEVYGIQTDSYKSWKETILDTVDSLVALEKQWISKGFKMEDMNNHVFDLQMRSSRLESLLEE
ncbi:hypothetical protein C8J57DRAFT_1595153 [Mycena rebaudengoi]|nr:hypothetical protein C8J57DRAFT_1595153 [Mycena rebaudengoi]